MAVMNGKYKHPANGHGSQYSEGLRRLIDIALIVDPEQRPDIHQVCSHFNFTAITVPEDCIV
jgi:serine/threonine kinase 16